MNHIREQYASLAALVELYLYQEYSQGEKLFTDTDTYEYFRRNAVRESASLQSAPPKILSPPSQENSKKLLSQLSQLPQEHKIKSETEIGLLTARQPPPLETRSKIPPPTAEKKEGFFPQSSPNDPKSIIDKKESPPKSFILGSPQPYEHVNFQDIRLSISKRYPAFKFLDDLPSDNEAKASKKQKAPISKIFIFSLETGSQQKMFLEHIKFAIEAHGLDSRIICSFPEKWETILKADALKLLIATKSCSDAFPILKEHCQEISFDNFPSSERVPLLVLPDVSTYLRDPLSKSQLWHAIKKFIF